MYSFMFTKIWNVFLEIYLEKNKRFSYLRKFFLTKSRKWLEDYAQKENGFYWEIKFK